MPEIQTRKQSTRFRSMILGGSLLAGWFSGLAMAQDAAPAAKPVTFLGTVQTLSGSTITVKNDAGATMQVTVAQDARLLRVEPGQKTLAGASPFNLADLQTGDRVMARGSTSADGSSLTASMLVAIKGADIAQKQERDREDWQKNGTGGLVKSVDSAAGTVTISAGPGGKRMEVIHASPTTVVRRYAPGSVRFDQAVKSTVDQIKAGDQLRARGPKNADGTTLEAEEIVSGSFLNLAGPIQAVNAAASTFTLNDSVTKKPVLISISPDSEVKKLDPAVAQRLAARLGGGAGRAPGGGTAAGSAPGSGPAGPPSGPPSGASVGDRLAGAPARGGSGPDLQQLLARTPSVTLKDLQKGNMVIVVATEGQAAGTATAITVVAGVEPMLQASTSASQAMLSSSWNLGGGGEGGGGEGPQ
jgi:Domain of unknown function (DUF5666)